MYVIPILLFLLGTTAGGCYGFLVWPAVDKALMAVAVGGFAGSALGGLVFMYLYITSPEEDSAPGTGPEPVPESRRLPAWIPSPKDKGHVSAAAAPGSRTEAKPVPAAPDTRESDKQKIRRLEKEIRRLKKLKGSRSRQ